MFSTSSVPLSSALWPQVIRELLGLIQDVSQVYTVDTAHCRKKKSTIPTFRLLNFSLECIYLYVFIYGLTLTLGAQWYVLEKLRL